MLKSFFKYLSSILVFICLALLVYRTVLINEIPAAEKTIPFQVSDDEIPVLKRPGTKSIRIVGPIQTILKFQLDFKRRPQQLDWNYLQRIDKKAEIFVQGSVDADGNFKANQVGADRIRGKSLHRPLERKSCKCL